MRRRKNGKMVFVWSAAFLIFLLQYGWQALSLPKTVVEYGLVAGSKGAAAALRAKDGVMRVVSLVMVDGVLIAKVKTGTKQTDKPVDVVVVNDQPVRVARAQARVLVPLHEED